MCPFTPYMGWAFPRRELHYRRYLSFEDATAAERAAFLDCLDLLIRKLASRDGSAVVLKSPGHTARIPMLLERWPDARFIVIHRDPYEVFRSSVHLYRTWWDRFAFLQAPSQEGFEARVLDLYETMHRRFFATRSPTPPSTCCPRTGPARSPMMRSWRTRSARCAGCTIRSSCPTSRRTGCART